MRRPLALLAFAGVSLAWSSSRRNADSLEVPNVFRKRASDDCPKTYTVFSDLDFDMHCGENQSGWDLIPQGGGDPIRKQVDSMAECMDACATQRPLCYGAVFNYDTGTCWFKNSTFTYQKSVASNSTDSHLAVARKSALQGYSPSCGHNNGSVFTTNSMSFTIHCDQDIIAGDYCPWAAPALNCLFHATSLSDCMDKCTKAQDLCKGVAFNPGMENGYGNCYGKLDINTNPSGFRPTGPLTGGKEVVIHSAVARIPNIDVSCNNNQVVASSANTEYTLQCDNNRPRNDLTQFHSENLTDCIDACDQYNAGSKCLAVVLDLEMKNGWQNCYLKGAIGAPSTAENYILAVQGGTVSTSPSTSGPTSSPTSNPSDGDSNSGDNNNNGSDNGNSGGGGSSSKAWIAGPVIGAIAAIALIGALNWWLQRRKRMAAHQQPQELASPPMSSDGRPPPPPLKDQAGNAIYGYSSAGSSSGPVDAKYQYGNPIFAPPPHGVYPGEQTSHEMEAQARHEMPAAHKDGPAAWSHAQRPVELPGHT